MHLECPRYQPVKKIKNQSGKNQDGCHLLVNLHGIINRQTSAQQVAAGNSVGNMFFQEKFLVRTKITELISQRFFNVPVRNYPHDCRYAKYYSGYPRSNECKPHSSNIKEKRYHPFLFLLLHCLSKLFRERMMLHDSLLKNII